MGKGGEQFSSLNARRTLRKNGWENSEQSYLYRVGGKKRGGGKCSILKEVRAEGGVAFGGTERH